MEQRLLCGHFQPATSCHQPHTILQCFSQHTTQHQAHDLHGFPFPLHPAVAPLAEGHAASPSIQPACTRRSLWGQQDAGWCGDWPLHCHGELPPLPEQPPTTPVPSATTTPPPFPVTASSTSLWVQTQHRDIKPLRTVAFVFTYLGNAALPKLFPLENFFSLCFGKLEDESIKIM